MAHPCPDCGHECDCTGDDLEIATGDFIGCVHGCDEEYDFNNDLYD
jgi:hypothetical protein